METLADKSDDNFELPEGHPQTIQVVTEQITVIRDVKGVRKRTAASPKPATSASKSEATAGNTRISARGKPTNFTPNGTSGDSSTRKTMAEKMKENAPYNLFFTEINDSPNTLSQKNSVAFSGKKHKFEMCLNV